MFLCSLIDELCTKKDINKTGRPFYYFDQCIFLASILHKYCENIKLSHKNIIQKFNQ